MSQKIAVAIVHGIGKANPEFKDPTSAKFTSGMANKLKSEFANFLGEDQKNANAKLEIEAVYWAPVIQDPQNELYRRLQVEQRLSGMFGLREFVFHSLADSIAYQITSATPPNDREIYDSVHSCFAETLGKLAQRAGENAPLCIIAHSLGTTIASNFIWDLQSGKIPKVAKNNPLERGETLALFYTLGSQIAFWSLRFNNFGTPVTIPSPKLSEHYPGLKGEWVNFYDKDDLLGYPVQSINDKYKLAVKADIEVNAGNLVTNWNPFSHNEYWTDDQVTKPIAQSLARIWRSINSTVK